jgi:cytochrome c oxidase subunit II
VRVHTYEKVFLGAGGALLVGCLAALLYASAAHDIHLPGDHGRIDPRRLAETPPFDDPGVHQTGPNSYDVVIVGRAWAFQPNEIRVPAGARITFLAASADVLHGISIDRTRVNIMLIPGQISRMEYTFREPGEHLLICHEYCGIAHHAMGGRVIVE